MDRRVIHIALITLLVISSFITVTGGVSSSSDVPINIVTSSPISESSNNTTGGLYNGLITYEDVALIVNDNSEISREIGTYFALKRDLPQINIINITSPAKEIITFAEYDDLANQVRDALDSRGLTDKINYMVTTKGVPLKVTSGEYNMNRNQYYESASVDSELMLLDSNLEYSVHNRWWEDNPYAGAGAPFSKEEYGIRLVTRLTGYTKEEAMGLVDKAEVSFGVRGTALLDMDPRKNGSSGYKQGNDWMLSADTWLKDNNHTSYLDATNTFVADWEDTMAYYSWGSNDGSWNQGQMTNGGFETGTGTQASGWTYDESGGLIVRSSESTQAGTWSLKLERTNAGVLRAYQDVTLNYQDHRYISDGRMSISGVTSPGARILLEGYDQQMNLKWTHTLANRTGNRGFDAYQDPIENESSVVLIRIIVELLGDGIAYFDSFNLRVVRPHNEWLDGSIAETIVSTGGRSMTYGTWHGQSLVADIIRDGVTGLKGYTWEPFITAVSRAHILIPAYYIGYSLAESFWMGSPYVSWMGTVIGDPKCTPFINERPDMGPAIDEDPISTWIDDDGVPWITFVIHNKGNRSVEQGKVEFFMEGGVEFYEGLVDIPPGGKVYINLSSDEHQITGTHTFSAVLDIDDDVWEYDEKNNEFEETIDVNHIPELDVELLQTQVGRVDPISLQISIEDPDDDISLDMLDILITGPIGRTYVPELKWSNNDTTSMEATYDFIPPWNASLGFYSLEVEYLDPMGSFDTVDLGPSIKVLNQNPTVIGNLSVNDIERGGVIELNLTWADLDTPDGSLELEVYAERPSGSKLSPLESFLTSNWSTTYTFEIPPQDPTLTWTFNARVVDRDHGEGSWSDIVRSYNRPPLLEVLNGTGSRITRLGSAIFVIQYTDPEGLPSESIEAKVYGPIGSPYAAIVHSSDFNLISGGATELEIIGTGLLLGVYSLELTYKDDENDGDELMISSAFEVYNIQPVIESVYINYPHGPGVFSETFLRSSSTTLTVNVEDLDSIGSGPTVQGRVYSADGTYDRELYFEKRGEGNFNVRISTDGKWPLGFYDLKLVATDTDGEKYWYNVTNVFKLDADTPFLNTGEVYVDLNMNATVEVSFGSGPGATFASEVYIMLYSSSGDLITQGRIEDPGDISIWTGIFLVDVVPVTGSVRVIDDVGREIWFNETLSIDVQKEPVKPPGGQSNTGDDNTLLVLMIILSLVILLAVVAIAGAFFMKKRTESDLVPAPLLPYELAPQPQIAALAPSPERTLPPAPPDAPTNSSGVPVPPTAPIPQGDRIANDSSYHRPDQVEDQKPPKINDAVPAETIPEAPTQVAEKPLPVMTEPSNTPGDVAQKNQNVQDTNNTAIPGDTGQGQ